MRRKDGGRILLEQAVHLGQLAGLLVDYQGGRSNTRRH